MIKKYLEFKKINEEVGIRNLKNVVGDYKTDEIWFHQDLDGVYSALCVKEFFNTYYGIKLADCHIIQYGGLEYAVKKSNPNNLPILCDFAHGSPQYHIQFDHHQTQAGTGNTKATYFKPARSNAEIISGEISYSDIFTSTDIELIKTVDSADFLKHDIKPEDVQNSIFKYEKSKSAEKNRFLMGLVVNRLLLALKNKRITVKSLDGKRNHINKNLLECLVMDSTASIYSLFVNLRHYINSAVSLEWDRSKREHNTPKKLITPIEIAKNLEKYIKTRKPYITDDTTGQTFKHKDIDYDEQYKIIKQYGIGSVYDTGSYDRYVVFKNFPDAEFICTIFPMGLIQASCNPFKKKRLEQVDLGEIAKEVLSKYKTKFQRINVSLADIKKINESEIEKMHTKYGPDYEAIGFNFSDLQSFYKDCIVYLPNKANGDLKTIAKLNLEEDTNLIKAVKRTMNTLYSKWNEKQREELSHIKIPVWDIIASTSGGHKSITNINGFSYMSTRRDLLKALFGNGSFLDVMKMVADDFINNLKSKIDEANSNQEITYDTDGIELGGNINIE